MSAMLCYVLGAIPPIYIMEGFSRRMWRDTVDKIGSPSHRVFLVRFQSEELRDAVIHEGYMFFNKRHVIMKK